MRLLSVCSARPNFVKLAAVHHAVLAHGGLEHVVIHTGQHFDPIFSEVFFRQLSLPNPDVNLGVHGGERQDVLVRTEQAITPVLRHFAPDWVLVYGDVNGALGAARAAKGAGIRLAHVEAGLRSFDLAMPEELNRIAVDDCADLLLCSEQAGMDNLAREGVRGKRELVGNTMIDTLLRMLPAVAEERLPTETPAHFALATLHRPSNVDEPVALAANLAFLGEVSAHLPVILPAHHRLRARLAEFGLLGAVPEGIRLIDPQGYLQFLRLAQESAFLLTDSGGIQEEAVLLKKRCFTLRRNTERPSTIGSGSNVLVDPAKPADRAAVLAFAISPEDPAVTVPERWDGGAGGRIVKALVKV